MSYAAGLIPVASQSLAVNKRQQANPCYGWQRAPGAAAESMPTREWTHGFRTEWMSDEARARIAAFMDAVALFAGGSYRRATQHKNSSGISRRAMFAEAVTCGRLCRRDSPNPRPARQDPHRGPAANRPRRWHVGSTVY